MRPLFQIMCNVFLMLSRASHLGNLVTAPEAKQFVNMVIALAKPARQYTAAQCTCPTTLGNIHLKYCLDFDKVCFVCFAPFSVGMFWMRRIVRMHWNLYYVQATRRSKSTIGRSNLFPRKTWGGVIIIPFFLNNNTI